MDENNGVTRKRRSVYVLPNLLTTGTIFFGFYTVVAAFNGDYARGAWGIVLAAVFDVLDGRVARATGTVSLFGKEYDSLADFLAFGVAPAALVYQWALTPFGRMGWAAAFLYAVCGALRLARFNVQHFRQEEKVAKRYFQGMPIPAAAGIVAITILFYFEMGLYKEGVGWEASSVWRYLPLVLLPTLGILKVSVIRFRSFKDFTWHRKRPFLFLVGVAIFISIFTSHMEMTLFIAGITYLFSAIHSHREYLRLLREGQEEEEDEVGDLTEQE